METRNVVLTLQKAKEFYNSDNAALKEIALQAFTEKELTPKYKYTDIKTFEDAVEALEMDIDDVEYDLYRLGRVSGNLSAHLIAIYKLDIIRKALNGADWKPKMADGRVYYCWVRFFEDPINISFNMRPIGRLAIDGKKFTLVSCLEYYSVCTGLSDFSFSYKNSHTHFALSLCSCKSKEIALYMGEYFGKIIFDACYAQHIGTYEWI